MRLRSVFGFALFLFRLGSILRVFDLESMHRETPSSAVRQRPNKLGDVWSDLFTKHKWEERESNGNSGSLKKDDAEGGAEGAVTPSTAHRLFSHSARPSFQIFHKGKRLPLFLVKKPDNKVALCFFFFFFLIQVVLFWSLWPQMHQSWRTKHHFTLKLLDQFESTSFLRRKSNKYRHTYTMIHLYRGDTGGRCARAQHESRCDGTCTWSGEAAIWFHSANPSIWLFFPFGLYVEYISVRQGR